MSRGMTKPTKWHVRPAQTKISLFFHSLANLYYAFYGKPRIQHLCMKTTETVILRMCRLISLHWLHMCRLINLYSLHMCRLISCHSMHVWFCRFCHAPAHKHILTKKKHLSCHMTKSTKWLCTQQRLRSAWASAQSDQSVRCSLKW